MVEFRTRPLYAQVRDEIAQRIASGKYPVGGMLPNEFALSQELKVSIGTIRKAVDILSVEKAIQRIQGRGTVIADRQSSEFRLLFDPIRKADGTPVDWQFLHSVTGSHKATETERRVLHVDEDADILMFERYRTADDKVIEIEYCHIPAARLGDCEGLAYRDTTIECLAFAAGIVIGAAEERVAIFPVDDERAAIFEIPVGSPTLKLDRIVFDTENTPIEWRLSYCNLGDHFYFACASLGGRDSRFDKLHRRA